MSRLEIVDETSGKVLGNLLLVGRDVVTSTAEAKQLFRAKMLLYGSEADTFSAIANSSNGYVTFRPTK